MAEMDEMDSVALLGKVVGETGRLVDGTSDGDLDKPTPCAEWTVRDLINHVTGGATMFAVSAEQGSVPDDVLAKISGDNLGDDYKGAFRAATGRALEVYEDPSVLDKVVTLPFGQMPAAVALNIAIFDVATHAADLAHATGQAPPDDAILEAALEMGKQMIGPELRAPGVFGPEQPAPAGATSAQRLLAFAGRSV
jgi:uncharacterized protein (TIGR03086 family)